MLTKSRLSATALLFAAITMSATALGKGESQLEPPFDPPPVAEVDRKNPFYKLLRAGLAERRAVQIKRLEKYLADGIFPRNRVSDVTVNIFRDEDGILCAIAYLVNEDGLTKLVEETATKNNQVKIGLLKKGKLVDWVLASGLTQDEVAAIQLPDMPIGGDREWFIQENERLALHLATQIAALKANNAASLDAATDRLFTQFKL